MNWKQVKPHRKFIANDGVERVPVATLTDGRRTCHVVVEDTDYVAYMNEPDVGIGHVSLHYVFPELHRAYLELPLLSDNGADSAEMNTNATT